MMNKFSNKESENMNELEKKFNERFGLSSSKGSQSMRDRQPRKNQFWQNRVSGCDQKKAGDMTKSQEIFCQFTSIDTYIDKKSLCWELIVLLREKGEALVVEEVRRPDFSLLRNYKYGMEGQLKTVESSVLPIRGLKGRPVGYSHEGYYTVKCRFTNSNSENICEVGVEKNVPIKEWSSEDVVDRLHNAAYRMPPGTASQLSALHDTLDKQLAEAGTDIFVYELLQNANDYPFGQEPVNVEFRLVRSCGGKSGYLCFSHTGAPFTARNVAALCSANDQDKSDNVKAIGYKGIGFKTVFRYNDRVEVRSGGFGFAFDRETANQKDGFPWRTIPIKLIDPKISNDSFIASRVQIKLFPHDEEKLKTGDGSYARLLRDLFVDERPLLFIPQLGEVRLVLDDWNPPIVRSAQSGNWCRSGFLETSVKEEICQQIDAELEDREHCRIPPKYRNLKETSVAFACHKKGRRLIPEEHACLYCYLPAKDADWGFRFFMNTDMIPNGKRTDIEYSIDVNKYFACVAGEKFFDWVCDLIKSVEYEYDSIFELIPDFDKCLEGKNEKVKEFIKKFQDGFEARIGELPIPADDGTCFAFKDIAADRTGLKVKLREEFQKIAGAEFSRIEARSLNECKAFKEVLNRYAGRLHIVPFTYKDLDERARTDEFKEWVRCSDHAQRLFAQLFKNPDSIVAFGDFGLKPILRETMLRCNSDLGAYEFLAKCEKFQRRFWDMPVEGMDGHIKDRANRGISVYFYNEELARIFREPWFSPIDVIVLSQKYDAALRPTLLQLDARTFKFDDHVFWSRIISRLDSIDRVNAFHRYIYQSGHAGSLIEDLQKSKVVVQRGKSSAIEYWNKDLYVKAECEDAAWWPIADGSCGFIVADHGMADEYWMQRFGNKRFNEVEAFKKKVERFLSSDDMRDTEKNIAFVKDLSAVSDDEWDEKYKDALNSLCCGLILLTQSGTFAKAAEMRLGSKYRPKCDAERFRVPSLYVNEAYLDGNVDLGVKRFFLKIGVREDFCPQDIDVFAANPDFCRYFWRNLFPLYVCKQDWFNCKCLLNLSGEVRTPVEVYSPKCGEKIAGYVEEIQEWKQRVLDLSFVEDKARDFIDCLPVQKRLTFEDAIDYLALPNSDKAYALEIIAKLSPIGIEQYIPLDESEKDKVERYRETSGADWEDGSGKKKRIVDLVAISSKNSKNAKAFSGREGVLKTRGLGEARYLEPALRNLGVRIIDDDKLETNYEDCSESDISRAILPGLLVYSAYREHDDWECLFNSFRERLNDCRFSKCSKITLSYKDENMNWSLTDRRVVRESKTLYYVGEMQNKRVFGDIAAALYDWLGLKGELEEFKDFLDVDTDLVEKLVVNCQDVVMNDESFTKALQEIDPGLFDGVEKRLHRSDEGTTSDMANEPYDETDDTTEVVEHGNAQQFDESRVEDDADAANPEVETPVERTVEVRRDKIGEYEVDADELEQLKRLFGDGIAGEDTGADERKKDESKLACLRLFNHLKSRGLEPSMDGHDDEEYIVKTLYRRFGVTGPNLDVKTGERYHVISAMGGVAYIPPRWWAKIVSCQFGKNVICAVAGARVDNFIEIRDRDDVVRLVGDNAIPIKIRGRDGSDRVEITTSIFNAVDSSSTAGKIYALLRLRDRTSMNSAFGKGLCSDEMSAQEVSHNNDL